MSVQVYPRLGELLREKHLSVAELERQIEEHFGIPVDPKTLYRLTYTEPVQRADLEIAGAVAAVLGVGLDDLFHVEATPLTLTDETEQRDLEPEESQRLAELFTRQARGALSGSEQTELDTLITRYGQRLHERRLEELARRRGISIDQARREAATQLDDALQWWQEFQINLLGRRRREAPAKRRRSHDGR